MENMFIVKKVKTESVVFAIRIDKKIQERLDEIAQNTYRSRNQVINMALQYAVDNYKKDEE
jgi:predicted transcriptional regulator